MKQLLFLILFPLVMLGQTQIGQDIDGEASDDKSGYSVSLSSDGSIVAVGAPYNSGNGYQSGHVRIYKNLEGVWTQVGSDIDGKAGGYNSGGSVSLSSDGHIVAIGAVGNDLLGYVSIYENIEGIWMQVGSDISGEAAFDANSGINLSLSSNGSIIAIGAPDNDEKGNNSGHVRIYENLGNVWTQVGLDIDGETPDDQFGYSVSLSSDGSKVAIGAYNNLRFGYVRIYENLGGVWTQIGLDIDGESLGDFSGSSVSLSSDGSIVAIGAKGHDSFGRAESGYVRLYENKGGVWIQLGLDIDGESAGDRSGSRNSVSLSSDGRVVAIGAAYNSGNGFYSGQVRIYKYEGGVWTQVGLDIDGEFLYDYSGTSVSLSSDSNIVAIGAIGNSENNLYSGHVRIYDLSAVLSTESFNVDYFSMYPNPAQNQIEIKLKDNQKLKQINIYTTLGKYLYSEKSLNLDISNLSSGIYILEVETNQGKSSKKIVKE